MGIYYKEKATQHLAEIHYLEAKAKVTVDGAMGWRVEQMILSFV
jgi:hypothetical protein